MMYDDFDPLVGEGYVRTCGGLESTTIDVKINKYGGVAVELGNWLTVTDV